MEIKPSDLLNKTAKLLNNNLSFDWKTTTDNVESVRIQNAKALMEIYVQLWAIANTEADYGDL